MRRDWTFWRFHFIWRPALGSWRGFAERGLTWWTANGFVTFDLMLKRGLFTVIFGPKPFEKDKGHKLEHSHQRLFSVHEPDACMGEHCTIHNMSEHSMRDYPQIWRDDRHIMERVCPHGVGHPDPDEVYLIGTWGRQHGCDGCCEGAYKDGEQE